LSGHSVFGSGGNLGFGRNGSHAEFVVVPENAVLPMPKGFTFEQSAGIGVAYLTAWAALVKAAQLQPGESVLILGTTGAVGGAAARIAHKRGARVLGTVRMSAEIASASQLPVGLWIDLETTDLAKGARDATDGKGADVVFDPVGGPMFEKCLPALAWRGRQVAISSSPDPRVGFNLVDFYHNESRLAGVDSSRIRAARGGKFEAAAVWTPLGATAMVMIDRCTGWPTGRCFWFLGSSISNPAATLGKQLSCKTFLNCAAVHGPSNSRFL
jgi:NADPH:quinone reductase-like Zn-dependent oxidoreductase